jgi:hypothetical protein
MPAARFIDVKVHGLLANRTLREQRMNSPPAEELYELRDPYPEVPHVRLRLRGTRIVMLSSNRNYGRADLIDRNRSTAILFRSFELLFPSSG